jgi:transcriptional regulator with XRE-family HTH domain
MASQHLTSLAAALRAARQASGRRPEHAAIHCGLSAQSIIAYEHGSRTPTISTLVKLADLYGCSVDSLVSRRPPVATR